MSSFPINVYLEDLKTLCAIDSGHKNASGTKAVADFFKQRFSALGFKTEVKYEHNNDFAPFLLAYNNDLNHIDLLLIAHMDTVFPVGTGAEWPFIVDQQNIGHGPGCVDCKGGCLLIEYLLRDLLQVKHTLPINICVALNSDEEGGSRYSRGYFEELARKSKYCFVFEPGREKDEFVSVRKGGANFIVRCHGIAAHSGVEPEKGASAILELAKWVTNLYELVDYQAGTTLNVGRFQGGGDQGSVPDYAEFTISFRYLKEEALLNLKQQLDKMQQHPFDSRTRIEVEEISLRPPMLLHDATQKLIEKLQDTGEKLKIEIEHISTGGGSDGNFVSQYGVATLDGCGPCGGKLHTKNEYLKVDSVAQRHEIMKKLIEELFDLQ